VNTLIGIAIDYGYLKVESGVLKPTPQGIEYLKFSSDQESVVMLKLYSEQGAIAFEADIVTGILQQIQNESTDFVQ
jgi:hypothetical protein